MVEKKNNNYKERKEVKNVILKKNKNKKKNKININKIFYIGKISIFLSFCPEFNFFFFKLKD